MHLSAVFWSTRGQITYCGVHFVFYFFFVVIVVVVVITLVLPCALRTVDFITSEDEDEKDDVDNSYY